MSPSISVREGIRWLPDPVTEPTRTVVLTSPENRFVDIRILRLPGHAVDSQEAREEDLLSPNRLDWAFAGTSSSTITTEAERRNGHVAHAKWSHWVDSRFFDAGNVSDDGEMFAMADGRTLERGAMVNPETGAVGEYEEVWRDVEIIGSGTAERSKVSESGSEGQGGKGKGKGKEKVRLDEHASGNDGTEHDNNTDQPPPKPTYAVLTLQDDTKATRGMIIQLGQFCQGILRSGEHIALERWIWGESKGWQREFRMGNMLVPCGLCTGGAEKVPEVGGSVMYGEWRWVVVEKGNV